MLIQTEDLSLNYQDGKNIVKAVKDANFDLPKSGFFGILGPSGSGKTSLLYLLSGIRVPTRGSVYFDGSELPRDNDTRNKIRKAKMGFVFQFHFLINYLTVEENILVGTPKIDTFSKAKAKELIEYLDLQGLEKRKPYELSGGQRQRVAIARSLINDPKIVFVDEPTASLDHDTGQNVVHLLEDFAKEACVLAVTHDETILNDANGVYKMWDGEISQM